MRCGIPYHSGVIQYMVDERAKSVVGGTVNVKTDF